MPVQKTQAPFTPGNAAAQALLKLRQSFIKQVVSYALLTTTARSGLREIHRQPGHVPFGELRLARYCFHHPAATVARGEIAAGMDACRVLAQNRLHPAYRLDNLRVLQFGQLAQTPNGAGDQHQIVCFFGILASDDIG